MSLLNFVFRNAMFLYDIILSAQIFAFASHALVLSLNTML